MPSLRALVVAALLIYRAVLTKLVEHFDVYRAREGEEADD